GVSILAPEPGAEFDPTRHQAIMHQAREGVAPGHVVATLQAGYMLGDRVIRPAKVSVAPSE
ncbi:MAG TPA: nucleotide exchange factor GrpE, partial [Phycisphaerales bacterium]|nr:nucleotide exchange factor GrpE [Phycisphaerales bacterium]